MHEQHSQSRRRRDTTAVLAAAALTTVVAISAPAAVQAQPLCDARDKFLQVLGQQHGEMPVAMGLASNGGVLEVFASGGGSWTILVTMPNGTSCVVAAGEAWEKVEHLAMGPEA